MSIKHPEFPVLSKRRQRDSVRIKANMEAVMGVILLFTATSALAQFESGTIIVIGYSKHKIVIAADSRKGQEDGSYSDETCKIIALNDKFLFASSGRFIDVTNHIVGWNATEQARTALALVLQSEATTKLLTHSFATEVANEWVNLIGSNVTSHIRPQEFAALKPKSIFVDGIFITFGAIETQFAYAAISRDSDPAKRFAQSLREATALPDKMAFTATGGGSPTFVEFLNNTSARAKKEQRITARLAKAWKPEEADARMTIRLVDLVIKYSPHPDVGRPVDAAELTVGQPIHWIQRKPNCKD